MKRTGNSPRTWNKLRRTLKRSQLRQARKEAEKQRKLGRGVSGVASGESEVQEKDAG